jgi:hypothetical protein
VASRDYEDDAVFAGFQPGRRQRKAVFDDLLAGQILGHGLAININGLLAPDGLVKQCDLRPGQASWQLEAAPRHVSLRSGH